MDDLTDCVDRVHATVSACLKRIGVPESSVEAEQGSPTPSGDKMSVLGRLGSRLSLVVGGGGTEGDQGLVGGQFGEDDGSGGGGLYLAAS